MKDQVKESLVRDITKFFNDYDLMSELRKEESFSKIVKTIYSLELDSNIYNNN